MTVGLSWNKMHFVTCSEACPFLSPCSVVDMYWCFEKICNMQLQVYLRMKVAAFSKISVRIYQTTRRHIPAISNIHDFCCCWMLIERSEYVKLTLSVCTPWSHVGGVELQLHSFDARLRWVVTFTPRQLYLRESACCTYWMGSWPGPRVGLDELEKRKISCFCRESNDDLSVV